MATISEGADVHTLIVLFTVDPTQQETLVEHLRGMAAEHCKFDGFVSCSIHCSEDGTRVAEYIQWRSAAHMEAVPEHPGGTSSTRGIVANRRSARCPSACLPSGVGNAGRSACVI